MGNNRIWISQRKHQKYNLWRRCIKCFKLLRKKIFPSKRLCFKSDSNLKRNNKSCLRKKSKNKILNRKIFKTFYLYKKNSPRPTFWLPCKKSHENVSTFKNKKGIQVSLNAFSHKLSLSSFTVLHTVPIKEVIKIVAYATGGSAKYLIVLTCQELQNR